MQIRFLYYILIILLCFYRDLYSHTQFENKAKHYYTIHLFSINDKFLLDHFIHDNGFDGKVMILEEPFKQEKRYSALYGHYSSKQAAEFAIRLLPKAFLNFKPSVKSMRDDPSNHFVQTDQTIEYIDLVHDKKDSDGILEIRSTSE